MHLAVSSAAGSVPPDDRAWFVYRACFFLGAGILFPWNSYITAVDYFERVHPGKHVDRVFGDGLRPSTPRECTLLLLAARRLTLGGVAVRVARQIEDGGEAR